MKRYTEFLNENNSSPARYENFLFKFLSSAETEVSTIFYNVTSKMKLGNEKYSNYLAPNETVYSIELMNNGSMKVIKTKDSPAFIITSSELYSSIISENKNILDKWKSNIELLINMMKTLPYQTLIEIQSSLDESNPIDKVIGFIIWMIVNENAAVPLNYTVLGH